MCNTCRVPIKVKRVPVTVFTENNRSIGGWFAFPRPVLEPSPPRLKNNERQLWCPFCREWTVFKRVDVDYWLCQGVCGWANTSEWYVRTYNGIWYEGMSSSKK